MNKLKPKEKKINTIDVVIPVYNEEKDIEENSIKLMNYLKNLNLNYNWKVIISDNASKDKTPEIGKSLAKKYPKIKYIYTPKKGRGQALRNAWMNSKADVVSFMDLDLSVDLEAFPRLIEEIKKGNDICVGSRFLKESKIKRSFKRGFFSHGYKNFLKLLFFNKFSDAQVGFKALRREVAEEIVPKIEDNGWFFDTDLLIRSEKKGFKIKEIPVTWIEDTNSTVNIKSTSTKLFINALKLKKDLLFKS